MNLSKKVYRVTVLKAAGEGEYVARAVYSKKNRKKRKVSRMMRPFERLQKQVVDANVEAAREFGRRYDRSRGKSRDGWLFDFDRNLFRAIRKGSKKIKLMRW